MLDLVREQGFRGLIAFTGESGLAMARKFRPLAISLDLRLPDMEGWALLDFLKHDPELRHVPVQILSGGSNPQRAMRMGAFTYLRKPVDREDLLASLLRIKAFVDRTKKNLLIVEDALEARESLRELLQGEDVTIHLAATGEEAIELLKNQPIDCMLLDLGLPDISGLELIDRIKDEIGLLQLPIIVHTGMELSPEEEERLGQVTSAVVIKDACSPDRLLQETALFLHRPTAGLESSRQRLPERGTLRDPLLQGKTVLIVDDDMRNIYALTTVLEDLDMKVLHAQNGRRAIEVLEATPGIDIVFMDIMMPEMDGYQASREIRKRDQFKGLPIIALTAKAMKGDRERCIEAGASDYIPKPVDTERLLSLLRVWLYAEK